MKKSIILFALLLFAISQGVYAQRTITGNVISIEDGLAMPGVHVAVKGRAMTTATNMEGNFTLNVLDDATIVVSFMGFKTIEIPVGNHTRFDIGLQPDAQSDETVVRAVGVPRNNERVVEVQMEQMRQAMERTEEIRRSQIIAAPNILMFDGHALWADNFDLINRTLNDSSHTEEHSFNLDKTAKSMVMSVVGNCAAGEIRIKILTPNGQVYSETIIDAQGNMTWRRTITISETENQDKIGDWKCQVSTRNATGNYRIAVQVN